MPFQPGNQLSKLANHKESGRKPRLTPSELVKLGGGLGRSLVKASQELEDYLKDEWNPPIQSDGEKGTTYFMGIPPKVQVAMEILKHYTLKAGSETPLLEVEDGQVVGLPPQMVNILVQVNQQSESKSSSGSLEIQSTSVSPSAPAIPTSNGSGLSSEIVGLLTPKAE